MLPRMALPLSARLRGRCIASNAGAATNVPTGGGAIFTMSGLSATSVLLGGDVNVVGTYDGEPIARCPPIPLPRLHGAFFRAPIAMLGWSAWMARCCHLRRDDTDSHPVPSTLFLNGVYAVSENDVWVVGRAARSCTTTAARLCRLRTRLRPAAGVLNAVSGAGPRICGRSAR